MPKFKIGDKVQMPGVPFVVEVLALGRCEDDDCTAMTFEFDDPGGNGRDWMHVSEFERR